LVVFILEAADMEIQSCSGESEYQDWLLKLVEQVAIQQRLLAQLGDPHPLVRESALLGLEEITRSLQVSWLEPNIRRWSVNWEAALRASLDDIDAQVRAHAIKALSAQSTLTNTNREAIQRALQDPHAVPRAAAIRAVGAHLGKPMETVLAAHLQDPEPDVIQATIEQLVELTSGLVGPTLMKRLQERDDDPAPLCRWIRRAALPPFPASALAMATAPTPYP